MRTMTWFGAGAAVCLALTGCGKDGESGAGGGMCEPATIRPRANPIEYVGMTIQQSVTVDEAISTLDRLFGPAAVGGDRLRDLELQAGVLLSVSEDPRTTEQLVVEMQMLPAGMSSMEDRRTILRVPVSPQYGEIYLETVRAALMQAEATRTADPGDTRPFFLEYRSFSANGGTLTVKVDYPESGAITLSFSTETPRTSLDAGAVNTPAFTGDPYEVLAGTVWFDLSRDEFAFFSNRAYGITSGAAQNFDDFQLVPHNWLRITVTPQLADEMVDVAFDVITVDGRRLAFARSPASFVAGDQFQQNVFRMVDNMLEQEARTPGSSAPWTVPFHYDDPEGGGVVKVIAQGAAGRFRIAYAVESPVNPLRDVDFLPYQTDVVIPDPGMMRAPQCSDWGSAPADRGIFRVKFDASSTVRESTNLDGELRGNVWGEVFRAADVTITGPREGATAVASFAFMDVDMRDPTMLTEYEIPTELPAGEYQILGFMDIDGNATAMMAGPDTHDPVTLPIGGYTLSCAVNPVVVEFALLLPEGR